MGYPKNAGWLIYNGQSENKIDNNWGYPHDLGNLHIMIYHILVGGFKHFLFSFWPNSLPAGKRCKPKVGWVRLPCFAWQWFGVILACLAIGLGSPTLP